MKRLRITGDIPETGVFYSDGTNLTGKFIGVVIDERRYMLVQVEDVRGSILYHLITPDKDCKTGIQRWNSGYAGEYNDVLKSIRDDFREMYVFFSWMEIAMWLEETQD